jgi:hypothetical protein
MTLLKPSTPYILQHPEQALKMEKMSLLAQNLPKFFNYTFKEIHSLFSDLQHPPITYHLLQLFGSFLFSRHSDLVIPTIW